MIKKLLLFFILSLAFTSVSSFAQTLDDFNYNNSVKSPFDLTPANINLKFAVKYQISQTSFIQVPDTLDHRLGTAMGTGVALFNDSISIPVSSYFIYDYVNGNGNFIDYYIFKFPNGSTFGVQALGVSSGANQTGANPLFQSTVRTTIGTGDFAGFTATGVMNGNRNEIVENNSVVRLNFEMKQVTSPIDNYTR